MDWILLLINELYILLSDKVLRESLEEDNLSLVSTSRLASCLANRSVCISSCLSKIEDKLDCIPISLNSSSVFSL